MRACVYLCLQSEEESASLALALAAKEEALAEGAAALRAAQAEVERLTGVRVELIHRCEEARQEAGEALELAQVYKREASAAHREAAQLQERLEQVCGTRLCHPSTCVHVCERERLNSPAAQRWFLELACTTCAPVYAGSHSSKED